MMPYSMWMGPWNSVSRRGRGSAASWTSMARDNGSAELETVLLLLVVELFGEAEVVSRRSKLPEKRVE